MKQIYILFLFILSFNTIYAKDLLLPTATISGGGISICQNSSGSVITFTGSGGVAPYTFTYRINGILQPEITTTGTNSSVTLPVNTTAFGTFNYTLESVSDSSVPVGSASVGGVASVTINQQANAALNSSAVSDNFDGFPIFKVCSNDATQINFFNVSTTLGTNTNYTINWGDGSPDFIVTNWSSVSHNYSVGLWTLTYSKTASNGCDITKTYKVFVGNNPAVGLGNPGNTDICITSDLTFPITGTENNPSGTIYTVTFNDGSAPQTFNHPPPPTVTHTFLRTSCGITSSIGTTYQNSFYASIVAVNPCDQSSATVAPIRISTAPLPDFRVPQVINCTNTPVCFTNTSIGGESVSSSSCEAPKIIWSISPNTGFNLASGSLGNDFGSANTNSWNTGSSSICPIFLVPGNYSITMKVGNKCGVSEITKTICVESPLTPTFTLDAVSGCAPLSIIANNTTVVTNSCAPPTYVWNVTYASGNCGTSITSIPNLNTTNAAYNFVEAGTYTITLTATNSCGSFSTTRTVSVKSPPTITAINGISTSYCGTATLNPTAIVNACAPSSAGLTYAWSFPGGMPSTSSLPSPGPINYANSGTYTVSLIVSTECGASAIFTKTFLINEVPVLTTAPLSQTICSGTATTLVDLTSNLSGTTFSWTATATPGITGFIASGSTNSIPIQTITTTSSSSGTITYVITPSINGCIGMPSNYVININPAPSIITQPASSTVCQGGTPTILSVALSSTSGSPTYQWYSNTSNNTTTGTIIPGETNPTFSPPSNIIGTTYYYCVIALTSGGCSSITSGVATVTIANSAVITNQPQASQNLCVGSTIAAPLTVAYSGGTGTPSYQWYSNSVNSTTGGTLIPGAVNATYMPPTFISAGSNYYYVVITLSGSNCGNLISAIAEVIVNNDPTIATQPLSSQRICQGAILQNLEVIMTDLTGVFSYQWYSNSVNNTTSGTSILGATASTYSPPTTIAGTIYYYCIITQNGMTGCSVTSAIATVITNIAPNFTTQPISNTLCFGQTTPQLNVAYTNGSGTVQYQWYSNTINSNSGGIAIASANTANYAPDVTSVGTLFYYCIITFPTLPGDCNSINSNVAEITVNPKPIIAPQMKTICSGATFTILPDNATGDIVPTGTTYTWSNPIVNPAGAVTGASFQSVPQSSISQTLINAITSPATVTYTVTPTVGTCTGASFTITVTVNPAINVNAAQSNITCFGANNGSITTTITGGIPFSTGAPYIIAWTGPNGFTSSDSNISGLFPGLYSLSITDAGGCPISNNYTILEPSDITITTDVNSNITCFGTTDGAISITVSGGIGAYNYNWTKNGLPFSTTEDIANLGAGDYIVSVTDSNNCGPRTEVFTITEPPILNVTLVSQTNVNCFGASTGSITINAVGGTIATDYSYSWSGPNRFTSSTQNLTNLLAGTYNLNLIDDLGCTANLAVTITESTPIIISAVKTPIVCYGDNNATISVSITGGNLPYQIQWSNLAVGLNQDNLAPGDYTITVTDDLGCQEEVTINIPSPPIFTVNPVVSHISCFGAQDGSIALNFVGGVAPVNLVWSDGSTAGITRNNLGPGTYSVTITDSKPCTITRNFTILEPQPLVLSANITNALNCSNANSGAIDLVVSGGTPPFIYSWSNGMTTEDLSNIPAGNYAVTVTDSRLCTQMAQYSLIAPNPIVLSVDTATNANCNTQTVTQNFSAQISGGVPPYQFNWSSGTVTGVNNEFMTTAQNGLIMLTATDAIGCTAIYSLNVALPIIDNSDFSASSFAYTSYGFYSITDPIEFTSTISGDYTNVLWDFGDGTFSNELNPTHIYAIPKNYLVTQTVTYPFGCVYVNRLYLSVEKGYILVVPTAFTPGDDGINDTFRPVTKGLKNIRLEIYDTWGSLIYSEVGDVIKGWDGKIKGINSENGNYYSKVSAETFYGTIVNNNQTLVLIK